jgi:glycosyltransferase involved in cell wall biosynthesis
VLANANKGNYTPTIRQQLNELKNNQYCLITFEKKIYELYHVFDLFVHVPTAKKYEAFGQIYIEAMAAGVPSIFTLAGIAPEVVKDDFNAIVSDFKNPTQILAGMKKLNADTGLQKRISENARSSVLGKFGFEEYMKCQDNLYEKILNLTSH